LVDLHAHPGLGISRYGVDPDVHFLPRGVTTVLSQGDAGARRWPAYRAVVIEAARTRACAWQSTSQRRRSRAGAHFESLDDADVEACCTAIQDGGATIWGIALNTSRAACGDVDPRRLLERGLEAAERAGRPLLFGSRLTPDVPLAEQLALLRAGDVLTYCFTPAEENILRDGRVKDAVWRRGSAACSST